MNKKSKKLVGASLAGVMSVATAAGAANAVEGLSVVSAASNKDVQAVHAKVEHITYSLKNNYLGLKNVGQFQAYIKEARALNAKLGKGSSQDKYADRINRAEALINAAARVNQVEKSMQVNAAIMKNVPQWEQYIDLAKTDLSKVDLGVFKAQYNELLERTAQRSEAINKVKTDYDVALKAVDKLYKEAEELAKTDKTKAIAKLKEAKEAADKLQTHSSKDEIIKKIADLTKSVEDGTVKPGDNTNTGNTGSNSNTGNTGGNGTNDDAARAQVAINNINNATSGTVNVYNSNGAITATVQDGVTVDFGTATVTTADLAVGTTATIKGGSFGELKISKGEADATGKIVRKLATSNVSSGVVLSGVKADKVNIAADVVVKLDGTNIKELRLDGKLAKKNADGVVVEDINAIKVEAAKKAIVALNIQWLDDAANTVIKANDAIAAEKAKAETTFPADVEAKATLEDGKVVITIQAGSDTDVDKVIDKTIVITEATAEEKVEAAKEIFKDVEWTTSASATKSAVDTIINGTEFPAGVIPVVEIVGEKVIITITSGSVSEKITLADKTPEDKVKAVVKLLKEAIVWDTDAATTKDAADDEIAAAASNIPENVTAVAEVGTTTYAGKVVVTVTYEKGAVNHSEKLVIGEPVTNGIDGIGAHVDSEEATEGAEQISTIALTGTVTTGGDITVAGVTVGVVAADTANSVTADTATTVAGKIRTAFATNSDWTVGGTGDNVTFTAKSKKANVSQIIGLGTTVGLTRTQTDGTEGVAPTTGNAEAATLTISGTANVAGKITVTFTEGTKELEKNIDVPKYANSIEVARLVEAAFSGVEEVKDYVITRSGNIVTFTAKTIADDKNIALSLSGVQ